MDPSGAVRVVAAEVLMRFGSAEQSQRAEELLIELPIVSAPIILWQWRP